MLLLKVCASLDQCTCSGMQFDLKVNKTGAEWGYVYNLSGLPSCKHLGFLSSTFLLLDQPHCSSEHNWVDSTYQSALDPKNISYCSHQLELDNLPL